MNEAQRRALSSAIANAEDNLIRAKMQMEANPAWKTGNGETIQQLVSDYQKHYDELREGL